VLGCGLEALGLASAEAPERAAVAGRGAAA